MSQDSRWHWRMPVTVRWADLDALGHVHHLALLRWCEDARNEHAVACGLPAPGSGTASQVVLELQCRYRRPVRRDGEVLVGLRIERVGRTSADSRFVVMADGEPCVEATAITVLCDDASGRPTPWPQDCRAALADGPVQAASASS